MDLFEYQGKQLFARYGIPVSPGGVADTVEEAVAAADAAGYPVVVKAQVQVGGRGKAGGVKLAENVEEVRTHARERERGLAVIALRRAVESLRPEHPVEDPGRAAEGAARS